MARLRPTLRVLPDGKVQVIGGDTESTMEMFNPDAGKFTALAHLLSGSANLAPGLERPMCVRAECQVRTYLPGERIFQVAACFPPANSIQQANDRACLLR